MLKKYLAHFFINKLLKHNYVLLYYIKMEQVNFIGMNELRVGSYIIHDNRPCKILSFHTVQVGKHGGTF